jgi:hypothetical protein
VQNVFISSESFKFHLCSVWCPCIIWTVRSLATATILSHSSSRVCITVGQWPSSLYSPIVKTLLQSSQVTMEARQWALLNQSMHQRRSISVLCSMDMWIFCSPYHDSLFNFPPMRTDVKCGLVGSS